MARPEAVGTGGSGLNVSVLELRLTRKPSKLRRLRILVVTMVTVGKGPSFSVRRWRQGGDLGSAVVASVRGGRLHLHIPAFAVGCRVQKSLLPTITSSSWRRGN